MELCILCRDFNEDVQSTVREHSWSKAQSAGHAVRVEGMWGATGQKQQELWPPTGVPHKHDLCALGFSSMVICRIGALPTHSALHTRNAE